MERGLVRSAVYIYDRAKESVREENVIRDASERDQTIKPANKIGDSKMPVTLNNENSLEAFLQELRDSAKKIDPGLNVNLRQSISFSGGEKRVTPGQYSVEIFKGAKPDKQNTFYATVSKSINDTILLKQGVGYQLIEGELKNEITKEGFTGDPEMYSGTESFMRRVSGSFALREQDEGSSWQKSIKSYFHEINLGIEGSKQGSWINRTLGRIAPSQNYLPPETSEQKLWQLTHSVSANIQSNDLLYTGELISKRFATRTPIANPEIGTPVGQEILNNAVLNVQSGKLQLQQAYGTLQQVYDPKLESPYWGTDVITGKPFKHKYVAGLREIGKPVGYSSGRITDINSPLVGPSSLSYREGQAPETGIRVRGAFSLGALPMQSGMAQFQLPPELAKQMAKEGLQLGVSEMAHSKIPIGNIENIDMLAKGLDVDTSLIGKTIKPGQSKRVATFTSPSDVSTPYSIQIGQNPHKITGYNLHLPASMESNYATYIDSLASEKFSKFQNVYFDADEEAYMDVMQERVSAGAIKNIVKSGANVPFVTGVEQRITGVKGQGNINYDFMTYDVKNRAALSYGMLKAMPTQGDNSLFELMRTLHPDSQRLGMLASYESKVAQAGGASLSELSKVMGYRSPEYFLDQISQKMFSGENPELLSKFGIGRVQGRIPIQEFTPETFKTFKEEAVLALMNDKERNFSRNEALALVKRQLKGNIEHHKTPAGKRIVQYGQGDFVVGPFMAEFVSELSGAGSDTGLYRQAMSAQNQGNVVDFLTQNDKALFRTSPGREAMQRITSGYLATKGYSTPDPAQSIVISRGGGKGTVDPNTLLNIMKTLDPSTTSVERMKTIGSAINELAGIPDTSARRLYHFPGQGVTVAGTDAWLEADSFRNEISEEGDAALTSQAQLSPQVERLLERLTYGEAEGVTDPRVIEKALSLSGKFVQSDQITKHIGGIFARGTGSSLLKANQVAISDEAMARAFAIGGGDFSKKGDWQAYQQLYKGKMYGLGNRPPTTVMGTEDTPGSISLLEITSSQQKTGKQIADSWKKAGMMMPEMIQSQSLITTMGDFDRDPYMLLPLAYKTEKGTWDKFKPKFFGGDTKKQYKEWNERTLAMFSPERQRQTFENIFGSALANQYNPYDESLREYFQQVGFGKQGETFLDKTMTTNMKSINEGILNFVSQKTKAMGSTYNTFIRSIESSSALLGIPEKPLVATRDKGGIYYQRAVDLEHATTWFESAMSSAGLWGSGGKLNIGFYNPKGESVSIWEAGQGKAGLVQRFTGAIAGHQDYMDAGFFSDLFTETPEREPGITDDEYSQQIFDRRRQVREAIEKSGKFFGKDNDVSRAKTIENLYNQGLIGMNSPGMQSFMTRISQYGSKDPAKFAEISALSEFDGKGVLNFYDEPMNMNQFREKQLHNRMLFEYSKRGKGDPREYMDIANMASLFSAAKDLPNQKLIREFYENYGKPAGFSDPWEENFSLGGEPVLKAGETIQNFRTSFAEKLNKKASEYLSPNQVMKLRSSSFGNIANFKPGDFISASALFSEASEYSWKNPALAMQKISPFSSKDDWNSIFSYSGGSSDAMDMGNYMESLWNKQLGTQEVGQLGYGIDYMDDEGKPIWPSSSYKSSSGGIYELQTKPDLVGIKENAPGEFEVTVTDLKNINSGKNKSLLKGAKLAEKVSVYKPQIMAYGAEVLKGPEASKELQAAIMKSATRGGVVDPAVQRFFDPNVERKSVSLKGQALVTQEKVFKDPDTGLIRAEDEAQVANKMQASIQALNKGEQLPYGDVVPMYEYSSSTPDEFKAISSEIQGEVLGYAEKAGKNIRDYALPSARAQMGVLKSYAREKYPEIQGEGNINLALSTSERQALHDLVPGFMSGDPNKRSHRLQKLMDEVNIPEDRVKELLYQTGQNVSALEAFTRSPQGGVGSGGGPPKKPPVAIGDLFEDPEDGKRITGNKVAQMVKETSSLDSAEMKKLLQGFSQFQGSRKWGPENRIAMAEVGAPALKASMADYGVADKEGNIQYGKAMDVYHTLPQSLSKTFEGRFPEMAQQIASAETPYQALQLAQRFAQEKNIPFGQVIDSVEGLRYYAGTAKRTGFLASNVLSNINKISPTASAGLQSQLPIMHGLSGRTVPEGSREYEIQQAIGTMGSAIDMERDFRGGSAKDKLAVTGEERLHIQESIKDFKNWMGTLDEVSNKLKLSNKDFENLGKHLSTISESTKDFRADKAQAIAKSLDAVNRAVTASTIDISKKVRGTISGEAFSPEEHLRALELGEQGAIPKKQMDAYLNALSKQRETQIAGASLLGESSQAPGLKLGSLARKMFGGFGLMYMGSIANIATTPMQFGYQEGQARQATFAQAMGQAMGGFTPQQNVEGNIQMAQSYYGGAGWENLRGIYGQALREQPGLVEAKNIVQAGLGGAAMIGWIGNMMGVEKGQLERGMLGAGLVTAGVAAASSVWGAYSQEDTNALSVFTHHLRKGGTLLDAQGYLPKSPFNIQGLNFSSALGYKLNDEQTETGKWLGVLDTYQQKAGGDQKDSSRYLQEQMGLDKATADKYAYMYAQALAGKSELGFSPEVYAQAAGTLTKYGVTMQGGLDTIATLTSQGYDVGGIATGYAYSPYRSYDEIQRQAGNYIAGLQKGDIRPPTALELENFEQGVSRYEQIVGVLPEFESPETERDFKDQIGLASDKSWDLVLKKAGIEQARKEAGLSYKELTAEEIEKITGKASKPIYEKLTKEVKELLPSDQQYPGFSYTRGEAPVDRTLEPQYKTTTLEMYVYKGRTEGVQGYSPEQLRAENLKADQYLRRTEQELQVNTIYQSLGYMQAPFDLAKMTNPELRKQAEAAQLEQYVQDRLQGEGLSNQAMQQGWIGELTGKDIGTFQRLIGGDARQWTNTIMQMPQSQKDSMNIFTFGTRYGQQVSQGVLGRMADINMQGQMTGYSWGTTSLQSASMSGMENANLIFGSDWSKYGAGEGVIGAMVDGFTDRAGNKYGGAMGAQLYMNEQQYQTQMAQIGIQFQQIALNKAFTTGVGLDQYTGTVNPQTGQPFGINTGGGGFWGIEDRSRALSYRQQEYGFGMQERQMDMSNRFFWQNFGLNQQQSTMQRGWTRDDWNFQDQTRGLQWGWKQEDYQENVRFMTGRDRRLAERQMMRETTMHGLEGEQIDKQRERQEELWDLEDRRFDLQKSQHEESLQMQREQLEKSKEFYEENKKLQEEQTKLSRAYWVEQIKLSEASAGASAAAAEQQKDFNDTMAIFKNWLEQDKQALEILFTEGFDAFIKYLKDIGVIIKDITGTGAESSDTPSVPGLPPIEGAPAVPTAAGKPVVAGGGYEVNDVLGGELFIPNRSGAIVPLSNSSVWGSNIAQTASPTPQFINMVVYLGNDLLMNKVVEVVNSEVKID